MSHGKQMKGNNIQIEINKLENRTSVECFKEMFLK